MKKKSCYSTLLVASMKCSPEDLIQVPNKGHDHIFAWEIHQKSSLFQSLHPVLSFSLNFKSICKYLHLAGFTSPATLTCVLHNGKGSSHRAVTKIGNQQVCKSSSVLLIVWNLDRNPWGTKNNGRHEQAGVSLARPTSENNWCANSRKDISVALSPRRPSIQFPVS